MNGSVTACASATSFGNTISPSPYLSLGSYTSIAATSRPRDDLEGMVKILGNTLQALLTEG